MASSLTTSGSPAPTSRAERPDSALSLYHLLDPEVLANPYPLFHRLRREDPVHWDPFLHAWIVTRYNEVQEVLHTFSADRTPTPEQLSAMGLTQMNPIAQVMVKQMLFMDASAHTRLRGLASKAFTPARVEQLRGHIREIVDRLLDSVEAKGHMDVIADFAEPLPGIVTAELLGVSVDDWQRLKTWSANFAEMLGNFQHNPERTPLVLETVEQMTSYFRDAVQEIKVHPREGLIHSLLTAEIDGDCLTEEEVIANSIVTMVGGLETTTNLIGNGLLSLLRNPAEMEKLSNDLALIPSAVEEMLRYESPSQHTARLAPTTRELGGKLIEKRQAVIAVMAAANRDPERFPNPDRFDIARTDNRHLAFGYAAHFCFGAPLARAEGQIAFERMLTRLHNIRLEPQTLAWRTNLGLRGLTSLEIAFDSATSKATRTSQTPSVETAATAAAKTSAVRPSTPQDVATKNALLRKYLNARAGKPAQPADSIARRLAGTVAPLSPAQEELWRRELQASGVPLYNECITLRMNGALDVAVLERSLAEVIRRHEIWRTTFEAKNGQPVQIVQPADPVQLPVVDLRDLAPVERESEATRLASAEARRRFDFQAAPVLRPVLFRMADEEHRLFLIAHQIVLDGMSAYQIFPSEMATIYKAFSAGQPSPLPEPKLQCSDFALWHSERIASRETAKQMNYWRKQLDSIATMAWPNEKRSAGSKTFRGSIQSFALSHEASEALAPAF